MSGEILVFKIAPFGSYGPDKMRSSSHIPSKVDGAHFEISKYKSGAGVNVFFLHFNRVKMSEATPSDLYFEIVGAPFTLLGMWEELLILAGP